jgi:copper chaperone CopZ
MRLGAVATVSKLRAGRAEQTKLFSSFAKTLRLRSGFPLSARICVVSSELCLEDGCVSETDKNWAALVATMVARIESDGVGSPTHEKAITEALDSIDGVADVSMENGAIHVTYDPLQTTEKKIEESIRASGNSITSAASDSETPRPVTGPWLAATREAAARE